MDAQQPVTHQELTTALETVKAQLVEAVRTMLHETETKLLTAFFQYQEHADVKVRKLTADLSNLDASADLRMNNLEQRVIQIEKRLLTQ